MMNKLTLVFYLMILCVSLSLLPNTSQAQTTAPSGDTVYVDQPFIPNLIEIEKWISSMAKSEKIGYCYRNSQLRPSGSSVATNTCPDGDYESGGLCYTPCPTGYSEVGLVCYAPCLPGYIDRGLCWKEAGSYSAPTKLADCPTGYVNTLILGCHRLYSSFEAPSRLADCPPGYTNMGLTCYSWSAVYTLPNGLSSATCPTGYFKGFADRCYDDCSGYPGYTNIGEFCAREANSLGVDYATCPQGYRKADAVTMCYPNCKNGYSNFGETCFADSLTYVRYSFPNPGHGHKCPEGYVRDNNDPVGLCFRACPEGYYGEILYCYANCPSGWVDCGLGCSKDGVTCAVETFGQVWSVLVVAANIATMGMTTTVNSSLGTVTNSIKLGSKVFKADGWVGELFVKVLKGVQSYQSFGPNGMIQPITVVKRMIKTAFDTDDIISFGNVIKTAKIGLNTHNSVALLRQAVKTDFASITSPEINNKIDALYDPIEAAFIKSEYTNTMLAEMQATTDFDIAKSALTAVAMIDPTGIVSLVNAFTQPICGNINTTAPRKPTIIYGSGAPNAGVGADGNYYVNTSANNQNDIVFYGPKNNGVWPQWISNY
jgi:hypothetical protein